MRTVQRVIAASALGLPLLLAGPGMALASHHHDHHGAPQVNQNLQQKIKIGKIAVSGNNAKVNVTPENEQSASNTTNNTSSEEEGED
jgi:hypothetical protein